MNPSNRTVTQCLAGACALVLVACGDGDEQSEPKDDGCGFGRVKTDTGDCVLDPYRFEPEERLDTDNVMYYGTQDLQLLTDLPPPPKSGFRLVMEPQMVEAGLDVERSQCWGIPKLTHNWIYTAEIHTTPGLHHANLYGVAIDENEGPQPYPDCRLRADSKIFGGFTTALSGGDTSQSVVPVVLFANSTQVIGTGAEQYALAPGYAFEVPDGFEVMTDVHLQNTAPDEVRVETVWDFYTMPADEVTNPTAMFVWLFFDFLIPARGQKTLTAECDWPGGDVPALMPHTHQWATGFSAEFGLNNTPREYDGAPTPGTVESLPDPLVPYLREGTGLSDSDIEVYDPPIDTSAANAVKFQCHFNNTTDHDMCFGIGENEMCFLFGYVSPPEMQRVGVIITDGASCITFDPAERFDPDRSFDIVQWALTQDQDVLNRLIELQPALGGGGGLGGNGCGG